MLAASLNLYLRRISIFPLNMYSFSSSSSRPLNLHGPPPRWTTIRALHEDHVLKSQAAQLVYQLNRHWTYTSSRYTGLLVSAEASVSQASSSCTGSTGCACLTSLRPADFLRLWASDSWTPE